MVNAILHTDVAGIGIRSASIMNHNACLATCSTKWRRGSSLLNAVVSCCYSPSGRRFRWARLDRSCGSLVGSERSHTSMHGQFVSKCPKRDPRMFLWLTYRLDTHSIMNLLLPMPTTSVRWEGAEGERRQSWFAHHARFISHQKFWHHTQNVWLPG